MWLQSPRWLIPKVALPHRLLTGRIRVNDHLVTVRKDLRIPIRCVKCQEYGHIQDACIGVEKCNCGSEFHRSDKCDRAPNCVSCGKGSNHPSTSPSCLTFLRKCEALDGRYPENTMPYFPSKEGWTWEASPANPPSRKNCSPRHSSKQAPTNVPFTHSVKCHVAKKSDSRTFPHHHRSKCARWTMVGHQCTTVKGHPNVVGNPQSQTCGDLNKAPMPITTPNLSLTVHLNEHTTTRPPAQPQNLAAKHSQIEDRTGLCPQHSKSQGLGCNSPPGTLVRQLW
jgi:hypothetical protein